MANDLSAEIKLEDLFNPERCDYCGECLEKCSWLKEINGRGGELFKRLADGEYVPEVLEKCAGCMSCNSFCSREARPYGLIVYRWYERYQKEGIPPFLKRALPHHGERNVWSKLEKWLSKKERSNLAAWKTVSGREEMLFLGCNQQLDPYIVDSRIFEGLPVFSDRRYCCGEPSFRLGLIDEGRRCAFRLKEKFEALGVKRLIIFCPACLNMLSNVLPGAFGIEYDLELVPLVSWLKERLKNGEIEVKEPLNIIATVQDSCHGAGLGPGFLRETREILELIGVQVKEMEYSGSKMHCCGLGLAGARYNLFDVVTGGVRRLRETGGSGAEITSAYCNGCYFTLNMMRMLSPRTLPVYHLVELVQVAMGEKPVRKIGWRRVAIFIAALEAVGFDLFRRARVKLNT